MEKASLISDLLVKHLRNELSANERKTLDIWVAADPLNRQLFSEVTNERMLAEELLKYQQIDIEKVSLKIVAMMKQESSALKDEEKVVSIRRAHFLKTAWLYYAAAIVIVVGVGTLIYTVNQKEKSSVTQMSPAPSQNDVAPGVNNATLTLADGSKIILDSAANGMIAQLDDATITKKGDQVIYDSRLTTQDSRVSYNTMSTPRGGQYQLTLPDGSQVWLNAESSITYPTVFSGKERSVSMTGEAYFEVTENKTKPFIVTANGKQDVEVLGTHFNINAYREEPTINTTLLEGSVRLTSHFSPPTIAQTSLMLKPGQQGQLSDTRLSLAANPDVEQVVAWKKGLFNFNNVTLKEAMKQLSRWYDVDIIFEGKEPSIKLAGTIGRSLTLSQVLRGLSAMELKTRLDAPGKKLVILE
jgi:transmembrane sensor